MDVFDRHCKKYDSWYDRNRFAYLSEIAALRTVIPQEGRGLEIGVGTGRFASALGVTMGIDPSYDMLRIAVQRGVNVRWGVGEDLPFADSDFEYVAVIVTLAFVDNPLKVLREAHRVLEDGGKVIVGIVNRESFLGRLYQSKKGIFYSEANLFTVEELNQLLKTAGFDSFSYYQTIFRLPERMDSIERPRKGFDKGGFIVVSARKRKGGYHVKRSGTRTDGRQSARRRPGR